MTKHQCLDHGEVAFCDGCLVDSLHHEISQLKAQFNNMEACYIEKKKEVEGLQKQVNVANECINTLVNEKLWYLDKITKAIAHLDSFDLSRAGINKLQRGIESALEALRGEL